MDVMKWFINVTKENFETQYLKQPTHIKINKALGFPNVFASLNCMHYWWKNSQLFGKGNFKIKMVMNQSFLKLL
jgi:hypothetical protein